ncbi:TauD/TfdA family dioxygenase [Variovorax sp. KK3]|uniref:TauD/TfdA family dioxygenase n=1 Tax=Variovorax sp. KK3 TaxID=1855728 RepID=UPI00097C24CC|nr:TauD/TfdA family dioxygenase [Variovorax sp. KK3]
MTSLPRSLQPVAGPSAWKPTDFAHDDAWCYPLAEHQVAQVLQAARAWAGRDFRTLSPAETRERLSSLVPLADALAADLATRGFALVRGVPVDALPQEDVGLVYWAIGQLLGTGLSQNAKADFLCPVTDMGVDFGYSGAASQRNVRGYQSRADLNYHCDPTDVVGLLCLRQAKAGGASTIVSTPAIFNEMLATHPEHLAVLLRGFAYDRKGEEASGEASVTPVIPVFAPHGDRVSCRYARSYILGGAQKRGVALTPAEAAALDCFDAIARREDMAFKMSFRQGDIQLLNNFTVVHGRTAYEDDPDPARRRFLYRLWLQLGDRTPWRDEGEAMRWAFARFGRLGRTVDEIEAMEAGQSATPAH